MPENNILDSGKIGCSIYGKSSSRRVTPQPSELPREHVNVDTMHDSKKLKEEQIVSKPIQQTMTPKHTLYHTPRFISSIVVQTIEELETMYQLKLPFQIKRLKYPEGLKAPEYVAINPHATVPALHIDVPGKPYVMLESGAIIQFILAKYDKAFLLHPEVHDSNFGDFLQYFFYALQTVFPMAKTWFLEQLYKKNLNCTDTAKNPVVEQQSKMFYDVVGPRLESQLSRNPVDNENNSFFIGNKLSVVDIAMTKPLMNLNDLGALEKFPKLRAHSIFMTKRLSFKAAYEA